MEAGADPAAPMPRFDSERGAPPARRLLRGQGARRVRRFRPRRDRRRRRARRLRRADPAGHGRRYLEPPRRVAAGLGHADRRGDAAQSRTGRRRCRASAAAACWRRSTAPSTGAGARLLGRASGRAADRAGGDRRAARRGAVLRRRADRARRLRERLRHAPTSSARLTRLSLGRGGPRDLAALRDALGETARAAPHAGRAGPGAAARRCSPRPSAGSASMACWSTGSAARSPPSCRSSPATAALSPPAIRPSSTSCAGCATRAAARSPRCRRAMPPRPASPRCKIRHNNVIGYYIEVSAGQRRQARRRTSSTARRWPARMRFTTAELAELETQDRAAPPNARWRWSCACSTTSSARSWRAAPRSPRRPRRWPASISRRRSPSARPRATGCGPRSSDGAAFDDHAAAATRWSRRRSPRGEAAALSPMIACWAEERLWLVTGPNMAGKSTFLRQNALIAILAQIGLLRAGRRGADRRRRSPVQPGRRRRRSRARPLDLHGRDGRDRGDPEPGGAEQLCHPRRDRPRHRDL